MPTATVKHRRRLSARPVRPPRTRMDMEAASPPAVPDKPRPERAARHASYARKQPHTGAAAGTDNKTKRRFVQLVCCLIIFGAALLVKLLSPDSAEAMKRAMADSIGNGIDYKAAFATVGQTLSSGGGIAEAFRVLSGELFGEKSDGQPAADMPEDTNPAQKDPGTDPPSDSGGGEDGQALSPQPTASDASPRGFESVPLRLSGWEVSLSEEDALDDTAPVPFGMEVPPTVDYTNYPIDFSHMTPVSGPMTSDFGYRDHPVYNETLFHYGVDIGANSGDSVSCFADGTVDAAGYSDTYGNYVKVLHKDGISTFYAHLRKILVAEGQTVKKGDVIAQVGMTGTATGPHLHFEVRRGDTMLDPKYYVDFSSAV